MEQAAVSGHPYVDRRAAKKPAKRRRNDSIRLLDRYRDQEAENARSRLPFALRDMTREVQQEFREASRAGRGLPS